MGYYDRPYRHEPTGSGPMFGRRSFGGSVTIWLIGINVVVHLIVMITLGSNRAAAFSPFVWGNFNIEQAIYGGQVWRFVTYQFLHSPSSLLHILFNMIVLYFFGPLIEQYLGSRRFLAFYLLCGCAAAVIYSIFSFVPGLLNTTPDMPLVGASGSVYGTLIACAVLYPAQVVHVWGVFPLQLRTLAFIILGIAAFSLIAGARNAGGEAAHLGGAALGFLLIKNAHWLNFVDRMPWHKVAPRGMVHRLQQKRVRRRLEQNRELEREVDRILDKVARQGLQSLTRREIKVLHT
ncbi:MAG: rhomboid family intramembrane serine protease, partial [Phycisphaeraceae bacterium]